MPLAATVKEQKPALSGRGAPGAWLLFIDGHALRVPLPLDAAPRELGREAWAALGLADERASRRHALLSLRAGVLRVEDLGSTNGTFVDGRRLEGAIEVPLAQRPVVRVGRSVLLSTPSLDELDARTRLEQQVDALARVGHTLCLVGEPGTGRASLARRWLGDGPNATLVEALEACAPDALRALALALAAPGQRVAVTAREELSALVSSRLFPADLADALARPSLRVPPLRERLDELPARVVHQLAAGRLRADASLVEACLLRRWPGNFRMLDDELATAAALARAGGAAVVDATHLPEEPREPAPRPGAAPVSAEPVDEAAVQRAAELLGLAKKTATKLVAPAQLASLGARPGARAALRAEVTAALLALLERHDFQQAAVAQALGLSRTTLLKLLDGFELPRASALSDAQVLAALAAHQQDVAAAAKALRVSVEGLRQRMAQPRR